MHKVPLSVQCIYGWSGDGGEDGDVKKGSKIPGGWEWRLPGLLYADDLVLYSGLEEGLRKMFRQFAEVCRRRGMKVNPG